jgi:hypothetical protein
MRKSKKIALYSLMGLFLLAAGLNGEEKKILLNDISSHIKDYEKKKVTLILKLKYVDNIFQRIIFYDSKNTDIEFDISSKELREKLKNDMLNLHRGMDYTVSFTVRKLGNLGGVIADLDGFKPVIIDKIP